MSFSRFLAVWLAISLFSASFAHADATHTAKVEIDLVQLDEKGKEHNLESANGDFSLDWNSKKCEIRIKKDQYIYCALDTSTDIVNGKGELVMKAMPQAHFEGKVMDAVLRALGNEEKSIKRIMPKIVADTSTQREKGFDLPFYSCGDCEKNGKDLILWNAYQSYITREITVKHAYLGAKNLIIRMKIKEMKPVKGAFNIIGNNNASEYGH